MKKGFTLVELITVIIVLGLIATIVVPTVGRQINFSENKAYEVVVNSIEEAARRYGTSNMLGYPTTEQVLELSTLFNAGLLKEDDLINPKTEQKMTGCVYYKWNENNNAYEYRYDENC